MLIFKLNQLFYIAERRCTVYTEHFKYFVAKNVKTNVNYSNNYKQVVKIPEFYEVC